MSEVRFVGRRKPSRLDVAGFTVAFYCLAGALVVLGLTVLPSLVELLVGP